MINVYARKSFCYNGKEMGVGWLLLAIWIVLPYCFCLCYLHPCLLFTGSLGHDYLLIVCTLPNASLESLSVAEVCYENLTRQKAKRREDHIQTCTILFWCQKIKLKGDPFFHFSVKKKKWKLIFTHKRGCFFSWKEFFPSHQEYK